MDKLEAFQLLYQGEICSYVPKPSHDEEGRPNIYQDSSSFDSQAYP